MIIPLQCQIVRWIWLRTRSTLYRIMILWSVPHQYIVVQDM